MCVNDALGQSLYLDVEDFLATLVQGAALGNKRMRIYHAVERQFLLHETFAFHPAAVHLLHFSGTMGEGGVRAAVRMQALYVDVADDQLRRIFMPYRLGQESAVLAYHGLAAEHHVLRALTESCPRIDIAADAAGTLLADKLAQVGIFADVVVGSTEVEDDVSSQHRELRAGRHGSPDILTQFHAEGTTRGVEEAVPDERYLLSAAPDGTFRNVCRTGEPTLFVELIVVGQICLGHDAQNLATLQDSRTVQQRATIGKR